MTTVNQVVTEHENPDNELLVRFEGDHAPVIDELITYEYAVRFGNEVATGSYRNLSELVKHLGHAFDRLGARRGFVRDSEGNRWDVNWTLTEDAYYWTARGIVGNDPHYLESYLDITDPSPAAP